MIKKIVPYVINIALFSIHVQTSFVSLTFTTQYGSNPGLAMGNT